MIIQIEPWIGKEELEEVISVIESTFLTESKKTAEFETRFKAFTNAEHAIAYASGSTALFASLKVLGIEKGDEVILPALTFVATPNSVLLADAKPIFVDIDRETFQIDPNLIEQHITLRTKAIMPVHLYGQSCNMDAIMAIAKKHRLLVIEDAAQGCGVLYKGKHVGTFGDIGVISFYGNKTITTGEGGMILTNSAYLARKLYMYKNHGRPRRGTFVHDEIGYNFSITEMQSAVGLAQLSKFDRIKKRKDDIRMYYERALEDVSPLRLTFIDPRCSPVHWFSSILVPNVESLQNFLLKYEIQSRRFFPPLHRQPCYRFMNIPHEQYPNANYAFDHGLSLPSSVHTTDEQLAEVVRRIKEFYGS